jgi:hypothetical protein
MERRRVFATHHGKPADSCGSFCANCKKLALHVKGTDVEHSRFVFLHNEARMLKTYATLLYGALCICADPAFAQAQSGTVDDRATCAAILANDSTIGARIGPGLTDSTRRDTTTRPRADSAGFGIGGARTGPADVMLLVGVHADEVRFGSQPHVRVRLCWGGDTLRVVQRDNLPSPVVPGTTYRNVYIAVELIGRVNAECLANRIGVGPAQQGARQPNQPPPSAAAAPTSASACAFLGAGAATETNPRPPTP